MILYLVKLLNKSFFQKHFLNPG